MAMAQRLPVALASGWPSPGRLAAGQRTNGRRVTRLVDARPVVTAPSRHPGVISCAFVVNLHVPVRKGTTTAPPKTQERQVFVYFDNDVKVRAPFDAIALAHRLDVRDLPAPGPADA
jgi:hypothetical protein